MKKIYFLAAIAFLTVVVSCKNGAEDTKNETTKYPTTDTSRRMEDRNTPEHPAPVPGDTVH